MKISKDMYVTLEYVLKDDSGEILDTSEDHGPLSYIQGNDQIIPGLEAALEGREAGDAFKETVKPDQAYGERDEENIFDVPRDRFEGIDELFVGMQVQVQNHHGIQIMTVADFDDQKVVLDGNHPLAGVTLHFEGKIIEVREATAEEIEMLSMEHECGDCCDHDHNHGCGGGCCE